MLRTCEVKENTKGHDAEAILRRQILVRLADVLPLVGHIVQDLNIGSEILVAPEL
jgi:hypothetical protein